MQRAEIAAAYQRMAHELFGRSVGGDGPVEQPQRAGTDRQLLFDVVIGEDHDDAFFRE